MKNEQVQDNFQSIVDKIDHQAIVCNKDAIYYQDITVTYSQLVGKANKIANYLTQMGVSEGDLVGVFFERSPNILASILAILKVGAAYVPLDSSYPQNRIEYIIKDAGILVFVTEAEHVEKLKSYGTELKYVDVEKEEILKQSPKFNNRIVRKDSRAYVIYTSGSTGNPKGVQIVHGALSNFIDSMTKQPGITPGDRMLFNTTICFDISALEMYLPLANGASIVMTTNKAKADVYGIVKTIQDYDVTIAQGTPSMWEMLLVAGFKGKKNLKILCGGETWSEKLADKLLDCCDSLWNMYGPTETTIWSMLYKIEKNTPITLGKVIDNTSIYLVDDEMQLVKKEGIGELYIGGAGVSIGYLGKPELTAERFIQNPFEEGDKGFLYKTGDLVKRFENGDLLYIGRKDFQIKLRGHRIELEEIEKSLEMNKLVKQAAVIIWEQSNQEKLIIAYYIPAGQFRKPSAEELRNHLANLLPEYMIPSLFIEQKEFPLNPAQKVDRKRLMEINPFTVNQRVYTAPETDMERELVRLWEKVLNFDKIGIYDDFFNLGGHSILAVKLVGLINQKYNINLTILEFLTKGLNIHDLSGYLEEKILLSMDEKRLEELLTQLDGLSEEEMNNLFANGE